MVHLATNEKHSMAGVAPVLVLVLLASTTLAQLRVSPLKNCGQNECQKNFYCRSADSICSSCVEICDPQHRNVDVPTCEAECQDYLHEIRFESKGTSNGLDDSDDIASLKAQVQSLKALATAALLIAIILALIVLGVLGLWCKKKHIWTTFFRKDKGKVADKVLYTGEPISTIRIPKDHTITLPAIADAVQTNGVARQPPREVTNMTTFKYPPAKKDSAPAPPSKVAPQVQRVPSEDSTYAYDNPALTPSPKSGKAITP